MEKNKQDILEWYIAQANPMPTLPHLVVRILDLSSKSDVDIELLADAILKDKVLTARMIRLVNSAFWGIQRRITSIREAIVYLGFQQIRSVVLTSSLFHAFQTRNPAFRLSAVWEHGLGCAMISRIISEKVGFEDSEKAYIAGLIHDIGEVILSQFGPDKFDDVIDRVQKDHLTFYEAESAVIGVNHTDFGPWFAENWGFSEELAEAIICHHTPDKSTVNPRLVSIVVLADLFCRVRGLDYGIIENIAVSFKDQFAWQVLSKNNPALDNMDLERFTFNLDGMVDEVAKVVKDVYAQGKEKSNG